MVITLFDPWYTNSAENLKFSIFKFQTDINTLCPCRNKGLICSAATEPNWLIKQGPRFGVSLCLAFCIYFDRTAFVIVRNHFVFISTILLLIQLFVKYVTIH